jgi:hypothetical protein
VLRPPHEPGVRLPDAVSLLRAPVKSDRYDVDEQSEDVITVARVEVEAVGVGCSGDQQIRDRRDAGGTGAGDCFDGC